MENTFILDIHTGYRGTVTLAGGSSVLRCCLGDIHVLTVKNVKTVIELLEENVITNTGMIRETGHDLQSSVISIQGLPAIRMEDRSVTSLDIRNIQAAKAKVASAVSVLLSRAELDTADGAVYIHAIDGELSAADAQRIGMVPQDLAPCETGLNADLPAQEVSLETPDAIHAYTQNVLFPSCFDET